tara:strand:- start:123 stop:296 length:174 start_codon:yes stop_codon:yes gene_type:complete
MKGLQMNQLLIELQAFLTIGFLFSPIIAIFLTPNTKIIGFVGLLWVVVVAGMFSQIG